VFNLIQLGCGQEEDWAEAHHYCLMVISEADSRPEGYYFLGYMYEMGLGCPREEETSFLYYMKAAKLKYSAAINKIADFYHSGFGV
jgi:TPR repeat protein